MTQICDDRHWRVANGMCQVKTLLRDATVEILLCIIICPSVALLIFIFIAIKTYSYKMTKTLAI